MKTSFALAAMAALGAAIGCTTAASDSGEPNAAPAGAEAASGSSAPGTPTAVSGPPAAASGWKQVTVLEGLNRPWGIAWLPDGSKLITEKDGRLLWFRAGASQGQTVRGVPAVFSGGQGGLMDVSLHPSFAQNRTIYLTLSTGNGGSNRTVLFKARLDGTQLINGEEIFRVSQSKDGGGHFGSRIQWLPDGTMLLAIGDGGNPPTSLNGQHIRNYAQDRSSHLGKLLRLNENGKAPTDNPFARQSGAAPEVWSYGHRNIQGVARDPESGRIFATEHGAKGGDELNMVEAGKNFGWPKATHSTEYWGPKIADKTLAGTIQPLVVWTPSTGPSGLAFYTGDKAPAWKGDLFAGGLASRDVRRVDLDASGKVLGQERFDIGQRVRDVRQGPDGHLYVLTDEGSGRLIRIEKQ